MVVLYVIKGLNNKFRYVGITNNIYRRMKQHNSGKNKSTSKYSPFVLTHKEIYSNYRDARKREIFLKSGVGRKYLDTLI